MEVWLYYVLLYLCYLKLGSTSENRIEDAVVQALAYTNNQSAHTLQRAWAGAVVASVFWSLWKLHHCCCSHVSKIKLAQVC